MTAPKLTFSLPGTWVRIDPQDSAVAHAQIDESVRAVLGVADDGAAARRRVRDALREAADRAREAKAQALFLCTELVPGLATPVTLTVHAPEGMRMSPAVGTSPAAVLEVLEESFRALQVPGIDAATRITGPQTRALRIMRTWEEVADHDGVRVSGIRIQAQYWFAVPGTKQVVLASFASPLGELADAMTHLFDAIAHSAAFLPE
ncbi:hypothetical protein [Microbacterium sp. C7(2022)]|uniref:hypothetical protein n=1 Tax=Microbacterium sp. C7(2022) TaxID=2992759 RepID=UPI00237BB161|nr:hypothetical protein [Microbacterium sp. C7(2022)]MDE0545141.1 hypothetical protein [Microbacterium sp. C7(2022)]